MEKKTVLITGASGMLGRQILKEFQDKAKWNTIGLAFSRVNDNLRKADITNKDELRNIFDEIKPDVVIHSAAEKRADVVEKNPEATHSLNVEATKTICELADMHNAFVVYMGTDYVFDGTNPPYKETDEPNPLNKYGQSKLDGEHVVLETKKDNIVLRVPILYGPIEYLDESAITTLFKSVKNSQVDSKMNDLLRRFPTHTVDVALVIKALVEKKLQDGSVSGIYHYSGDENMTKYSMAKVMGEVFHLNTDHIIADKSDSGGAKRPQDAHLDTTKLVNLGINHRRPFKEAIQECLTPFMNDS